MKLTKGIIKADIITAKQAIAYFDEKHIKDMKILLLIIFNRQRRN